VSSNDSHFSPAGSKHPLSLATLPAPRTTTPELITELKNLPCGDEAAKPPISVPASSTAWSLTAPLVLQNVGHNPLFSPLEVERKESMRGW
jgi:hypothetical protein